MLGYTQIDKNICIFLEGNDIKYLNKRTINGTYVNQRDEYKKGVIELSKINKPMPNNTGELIDRLNNTDSEVNVITDGIGSIIKISVGIKSSAYYELVEQGYSQAKNQDRQVLLYDANRVLLHGNQFDQLTYGLLKQHEVKLNKRNKKSNMWNRIWQRCLNP